MISMRRDHFACVIPYLTVSDHIQERDNVWSTTQVLQDLNLTLDLLLLDRLQNLDDAFLVVDNIDALEYLGVFSSPYALILVSF